MGRNIYVMVSFIFFALNSFCCFNLQRYDMASYVYQYFNLLKTIDGYEPLSTHIKEVKSLMRMKFGCLDFDSEQLCDPSQFSLVLAGFSPNIPFWLNQFLIFLWFCFFFIPVNILKFSVTKAISLDFLYGFGDEKAFKEMLGNFVTKNMRIFFLSKPFTEEGIFFTALVCSIFLI